MSRNPLILVAAGGTGGHLFPAEALSHALARRGLDVELVTDNRVEGFAKEFPARAVHALPAATPSGKGLAGKALAAVTLGLGTLRARGARQAPQARRGHRLRRLSDGAAAARRRHAQGADPAA